MFKARINSFVTHKNLVHFTAIFALALFSSCREGHYVPDAEFVDLYVELKLASVASTQDPGKANEVRKSILAQHGMTPVEFHERFVRLANHPDAWRSFQENVVNQVDAFQRKHKGEIHGQ